MSSENYDEKLIERLNKNGNTDRLFRNRTDIYDEITSVKKEIEAKREIINKVIALRDKYYAHSDPDSVLPKVGDTELDELVKLAVKIYNQIRGKLFDVTFLFDINADWKVDYPVKMLAQYRKEQTEKRNPRSVAL